MYDLRHGLQIGIVSWLACGLHFPSCCCCWPLQPPRCHCTVLVQSRGAAAPQPLKVLHKYMHGSLHDAKMAGLACDIRNICHK